MSKFYFTIEMSGWKEAESPEALREWLENVGWTIPELELHWVNVKEIEPLSEPDEGEE